MFIVFFESYKINNYKYIVNKIAIYSIFFRLVVNYIFEKYCIILFFRN